MLVRLHGSGAQTGSRLPSLKVVGVMYSNSNQKQKFKQAPGNPLYGKASEKRVNSQCSTQVSQRHTDLSNVDFVFSNVNSSHTGAMLYIFEDNEAVIKKIIKGRNPTLRHDSRTHRVALDRLFDRLNLDHQVCRLQKPTRRHFD